jgi:adenosylmethionine-8-amino-7-oxononanoate aminotransferase
MVYPMGGTIDGKAGDHVLLAPPFIVTDSELDLIVARLAAAVEAAIDGGGVGRRAADFVAPAKKDEQ